MLPTKDTSDVSLDEYVSVLRRRWIWILLPPLILGGLALLNGLRAQPVYQAQSQMLLRSASSDVLNITGQAANLLPPERELQNELRVITSASVKQAVSEAYGESISVRAVAGGEDDLIILIATANSAEEAAERANAYAETYQTVRVQTQLEDLAATSSVIQQQIDDYQAQVDEINEPLAALDLQILALAPTDPEYRQLTDQRAILEARTEAERSEAQRNLDDYLQRFQILRLKERLVPTGGIQIINPASVPSSPVSPNIARDVIQALIIGAFLGLALAFVRDQFDDSLRTKADVERAVRDLPTLGLVPYDTTSGDVRQPKLSTLTAPMSATAEAYRGLRTAIQYAALERPLRIVQVTSASAGEAKTTSLTNLAMTFALSGKRVALVDGDLRKPKLHRFMQVDGTKGFTSVVLGDITLDEAMQTSPLHPNVDVLPSGYLPPNPSELLSHDRTARILQSLTERYSIVFIDSPPVLPVTDSLVISRYADATLFMVMSNRTTRRTARRATEMLRQVGAPLLGTVISGAADQDTYGSLYEYYGYVRRSNVPFIGKWLSRKGSDIPSSSQDMLPQSDADEKASTAEQVST
jgi:capsular exopolysaccharide synthesis family protein